jgi:hypothetical protein
MDIEHPLQIAAAFPCGGTSPEITISAQELVWG